MIYCIYCKSGNKNGKGIWNADQWFDTKDDADNMIKIYAKNDQTMSHYKVVPVSDPSKIRDWIDDNGASINP